MNGASGAAAIIAKQQAHARHAFLVQDATPLPQEILEMSLATCFEQQAERFPQRSAVVAAEGMLTYQELNEAANRLAHYLLAMDIAVDAPVAILLEQGLDTVVSMLAVLKTGGYFFCLEPTLPMQRARELLNLAATRTIITTSTFVTYVEKIAPEGNTRFLLDHMAASDLAHNPNIPIAPHQPSTMTFTSGSTGMPKPTLKSHAGHLYSAWQSSNDYHLSPADRCACVYQFDVGLSMRAFFSTLLVGSAMYLYPGVNYDMSGWAAWLEAQEITQLYGPTAAIRELMHTRADAPNFPSLRMVYVAGQTVYRQDAETFQRRFSRGAILISLYGMAETATLTHYLVDHDTQFDGETLPIGYPVAGRDLLIVDEEERPLGPNQPGEIVLRHRVASMLEVGDLPNRCQDSLTADAERVTLFHTADIGLQRADGCLVYLGRKDDMVKVRGNRVTLTETESWLLKVGGVAQAAIKAFPTSSGDNRLVGYVTPTPDAQITEASIRAELHRSVPSYMVPARIVVLPSMPLTTTGKVDRQSLPPPDLTRPNLATPFVAPRTAVEQQIAHIWAELLSLDEIGANDNFFELGGDSLSAVRMVVTVEGITTSTVPPEYFRAPTVASLAAFCRPDAASASSQRAATITSQPRNVPHLLARIANGQVTTVTLVRKMIHERVMRLPYRRGVKWLAWLGRPAVANRLFSHERQWLHSLARELDNPAGATDEAFAASIFGNLIRDSFLRSWLGRPPANGDLLATMRNGPELFWRTFVQQFEQPSQGKAGPHFHVTGLEHLIHAQRQGHGTILVTYHCATGPLASTILAHQTNSGRIFDVSLVRADSMAEETWAAEWGEDEESLARVSGGWAATYALQAQRILQKGGMVRIANDVSYDAANSLAKVIGQRHYNLKPGIAELALTTHATVLPYYSAFDRAGGIHLTILPALAPQAHANDANAFIHALIDQYVAFLETAWRESPDSLGWGSLRRYNHRPLAVTPRQAEFSAQVSRG